MIVECFFFCFFFLFFFHLPALVAIELSKDLDGMPRPGYARDILYEPSQGGQLHQGLPIVSSFFQQTAHFLFQNLCTQHGSVHAAVQSKDDLKQLWLGLFNGSVHTWIFIINLSTLTYRVLEQTTLTSIAGWATVSK